MYSSEAATIAVLTASRATIRTKTERDRKLDLERDLTDDMTIASLRTNGKEPAPEGTGPEA
jgi:hypothetical protein